MGGRLPVDEAMLDIDGQPIKAGSRSRIPTLVEDLFPTLLGVAGVALPGGHVVDGKDLAPALRGEIDDWPEPRPLVFHYPHQWTGKRSGGYQPHSWIRLGEWKAIRSAVDPEGVWVSDQARRLDLY